MKIDKDSHLPFYMQVASHLKKMAVDSEIKAGAKLPTEADIASEYGVSRGTVRQALDILENDGFIKRQQGKGTYIVPNPTIQQNLSDLESLSAIIKKQGGDPRVDILDFRFMVPCDAVKKKLAMEEDESALFILRRHCLQDDPVALAFIYIPYALGRFININDVKEKTIFELLEEKCQVSLHQAQKIISAYAADDHMVELLNCEAKDALLVAERLVYDVEERPVELVTFFYRTEWYGFCSTLPWQEEANMKTIRLDWSIEEDQLFFSV